MKTILLLSGIFYLCMADTLKTEASSSTRNETSMELRVFPAKVALGSNLQIIAVLKDACGEPLANKKVAITYDMGWNYADYLFTDSAGRLTYTLPIKNDPKRTGFCASAGSLKVPARYQIEAYFPGDQNYRGVMALANFLVTSTEPSSADEIVVTASSNQQSVKKPVPVIYWMWDSYNFNPNDAPEDLRCPACQAGDSCTAGDGRTYACENDPYKQTSYGPFGGLYYQHWNRLNYAVIDSYLVQASSMELTLPDGRKITKPVIFGFYFFDASGDHSAYSGGSYTLSPSGCQSLTAPKYCDAGWQEAYKQAVFDLGKRYDGKFSAVLVSFGFDGEAVMAKNSGSCDYKAAMKSLCSENAFNKLVLEAAQWHKQAFPNTPVYVQGHPFDAQRGIGAGFGYKTNAWIADSGLWTYSNIADSHGEANVWYKYPSLLRAFESRYSAFYTGGISDYQDGIYAGTYWMLMNMMGNKPDFIDLYRDHWQIFLKLPWLNEFITAHLGKTAETTPSVWIVLREVQDSIRKENLGCQMSGVYGDYQFYLYRRENIPANKTVALTKLDLPQEALKQPYTNPSETDAAGNKSPSYSARRTDQASGNSYMSFDIDNGWSFAGLLPGSGASYKVILIYLDKASDNFYVEYPDATNQLKKITLTKTNTNQWIRKEFMINDAYFNDQLEGYTDIRINCNNDGDEIIHMLQIIGNKKDVSDSVPPSVVSNLKADAISSTQINLSWSAASDNIGVAGYKIYRDSGLIADISNTFYFDTGLPAATTYTYTLSAYDYAGNISDPSSPGQATTQAPPGRSCSWANAQETGNFQLGLTNTWNQYVIFTPASTGYISKIAVEAGNYGGAWRSLGCKITDSTGNVTILPEASSEAFRLDSGAAWRTVTFSGQALFESATTYRLYCRGPDTWRSMYWIYDYPQGSNAKTYKIYICPATNP